jgi:hypothetical protein
LDARLAGRARQEAQEESEKNKSLGIKPQKYHMVDVTSGRTPEQVKEQDLEMFGSRGNPYKKK